MSSSLWLFGFLLGMRHALEPDHLAAVSTLVVEQRRVGSGVVLGGMWGLGHTLALLVVATLLALAGAAMPPRLATVFELGVAGMLIGIGGRSIARAVTRATKRATRDHTHTDRSGREAGHDAVHGADHDAGHGAGHDADYVAVHGADYDAGHDGTWVFARRSLLVGSVHGLAGSGALTALVASRLSSAPERLFYIGLFGLGSVMGMSALSGAAGWPLARLGRSPTVARVLMMGTGLLAFGLGIVWGLPLVRELLS